MIDIFYSMFEPIKEVANWVLIHVNEQQGALVVLASTAIVGAAGAYFGSIGAQRSINREMALRRRIEKIAVANAAHSLATVIYNQSLSLKKQYFLPTFENWRSQRDVAVAAISNPEQVAIPLAIHMNSFPPIHFPMEELSGQLYGKLTLNGRPLAALAELFQASHTLKSLAEDHSRLTHEFKGKPDSYTIPIYLALETAEGIDSRYEHLCHGSLQIIDDLIFFSDVLANDLIAYGHRQVKFAPRRQRRFLPEVNAPGRLLPEYTHLIPTHEIHQTWLSNYVIIEPEIKRWYRCK